MNTENNKLIAEFLGDKIELRDYGSALPGKKAFYYVCKNSLVFLCMDNGSDNALHEVWMREAAKLTFHKDWNTLMEVVEKIEQSGCIVNIWMSLGKGCKIMRPSSEEQTIANTESNSLIEAVYTAVVEFITWYNKQQPKK